MDSVISSVIGVLLVFLILLVLLWCCCKTRGTSSAEGSDIEKGSSSNKDPSTVVSNEESKHQGTGSQIDEDPPTTFDFKTLKNATGNFSDDNKLGRGGFGVVYQGILNGKEVAVKRLCKECKQGKQQFLNEVKVLAKLQHRNLVQIIGCCSERSEKLLVYEYLPNKSLDKFLFDPQRSIELDWGQRFKIILGIASGLEYLHTPSPIRTVHRDIKAANILLDERMEPKIADFGLARMFTEDETHVSTNCPAGTFGYMAPESFTERRIYPEVDIYSFGVLVLEIVCGRQNKEQILTKQVWKSFKSEQSVDVIDRNIIEKCDKEEVMNCIHVGLLCIQEEASLRPSMSYVRFMLLNRAKAHLENPQTPAYVNITDNNMRSGTGVSSTSSYKSAGSPFEISSGKG